MHDIVVTCQQLPRNICYETGPDLAGEGPGAQLTWGH